MNQLYKAGGFKPNERKLCEMRSMNPIGHARNHASGRLPNHFPFGDVRQTSPDKLPGRAYILSSTYQSWRAERVHPLSMTYLHFFEQAEVFLGVRSRKGLLVPGVPERLLGGDLFGTLVIDVSQAFPNQVTGVIEELLEIIAGVELPTIPFEP